MELTTDILIPVALGLLSAFGATWYSNRKSAQQLKRANDERASDAVRAYIRALNETSDHLEAEALKFGGWDPTSSVINPGGLDAVRAAFNVAAPFFHRLQVRASDNNPLRNEFPDYGDHPMDGSENYAARAKEIQAVLDRGLKP